MLGIGLGIPELARHAMPDPATAGLIARMSAPPGPARAGLIDTAIRALKAMGLWTRLDGLWLLAAHDAQAARLNWIADAYNLSAVNAPAFTADRGYAGDGSTSYVDTGWAPNMGSQNDASFGVWVRTNLQASWVAGWTDGGAGTLLAPRDSLDRPVIRINQTTGVAGTSGGTLDGSGFTLASRTASNVVRGYRNGVLTVTSNFASAAPIATSLKLGRWSATSYAAHEFAAAAIGRGLDDVQQQALHAILAAYMTGVGA